MYTYSNRFIHQQSPLCEDPSSAYTTNNEVRSILDAIGGLPEELSVPMLRPFLPPIMDRIRTCLSENAKHFNSGTDRIMSVAYSPNGKHIATGSDGKTMEVWDIATGRVIRKLMGHAHWVSSIVYSPDGKNIASGSLDNMVKVWDAQSGELIKTLTGHTRGVNSVVYSPDGKRIASGSNDNTVIVWDVETGSVVKTLTGHTHFVNSVAYSPDGKNIASGSNDKKVKVWNVETGNVETLAGHTGGVTSVAYSPDGKNIASGSWDRTIQVWNVETGEVKTFTSRYTVDSVSYSPSGEFIATASIDSKIIIWDALSEKWVINLAGPGQPIYCVTFSPDGSSIAFGVLSTLVIWGRALESHLKELKRIEKDQYSLSSRSLFLLYIFSNLRLTKPTSLRVIEKKLKEIAPSSQSRITDLKEAYLDLTDELKEIVKQCFHITGE